MMRYTTLLLVALTASGCQMFGKTTINENGVAVPNRVESALEGANPGESVSMAGVGLSQVPEMETNVVGISGSQVLVSNNPETVSSPETLLLREKVVPGTVRLILAHRNGTDAPRKVSAIIENQGGDSLTVGLTRLAIAKTSGSSAFAAEQAFEKYSGSSEFVESHVVSPNGSIALTEELEESTLEPGELVYAILELAIDSPSEISVVQTAPEKASMITSRTQFYMTDLVEGNGVGRGGFMPATFSVKPSAAAYDTDDGPVVLTLEQQNFWPITKTDETTPPPAFSGNPGQKLALSVPFITSDGRNLSVAALPEADSHAPGLISLNVNDGQHPGGGVSFSSEISDTDGVPLQTFSAMPNGHMGHVEIEYLVPPGAHKPLKILLMPTGEPRKKATP